MDRIEELTSQVIKNIKQDTIEPMLETAQFLRTISDIFSINKVLDIGSIEIKYKNYSGIYLTLDEEDNFILICEYSSFKEYIPDELKELLKEEGEINDLDDYIADEIEKECICAVEYSQYDTYNIIVSL